MTRAILRSQIRRIGLFAVSILGAGLSACAAPQTLSTDRTPVGVVAADHGLASEAGAEMLRLGGNAVDAAVAASLALSVVRPDACGIGGGGFMVIHLEDDQRHGTRDIALNYRETCPTGIGPDSYEAWGDRTASYDGGRAVGIPGTVAGLLHALEEYGTLDRVTVFRPAIDLAERGWPADGHHVRTAESLAARFSTDDSYPQRFGFVWNTMTRETTIREGDRLINPDQARALRLIAKDGRSAFYEGPIADAIVAAIQADGGVITLADLAGYTAEEAEPIRVPLGRSFGDRSLLVMPPPSSGGIAIAQMFGLLDRLNELDGFEMPATGLLTPRNAHLLIESMKHAFADRSRHLADPAFADLPIAAMLDHANLDRAAASVDTEQTRPITTYGVAPFEHAGQISEDGGTSHISVVDRHGNAVACTETINLAFGSMLEVDGFGFCLNNQMDDFTTVRGAANAFGLAQSDDNLPEPGKRPLSSMSPTIVLDTDGEVFAVAGASGGPRIISATAQSLARVLLADASAQEAVDAPRLHHQWQPDAVFYETHPGGVPSGEDLVDVVYRDALAGYGHSARPRRDIGACQLIRVRRAGNQLEPLLGSSSDPRKGGSPVFVPPAAD